MCAGLVAGCSDARAGRFHKGYVIFMFLYGADFGHAVAPERAYHHGNGKREGDGQDGGVVQGGSRGCLLHVRPVLQADCI